MVDAQGIPLAVRLTTANIHDSQLFEEMLEAIPALKHRGPGRPRHRRWASHYEGFLHLGCARICWNYLAKL